MSEAILVTCLSVGTHPTRLTRGQVYAVLSEDPNHGTIRIHDDKRQSRSFPQDLFMRGVAKVASVVSIEMDEPRPEAPTEVTLTFSDGQRRFVWVATPEQLASCGDLLPGTDVRMHLDNRSVFIVSRSDEGIIRSLIAHTWSQGLLEAAAIVVGKE